jgi:hypothetical protein
MKKELLLGENKSMFPRTKPCKKTLSDNTTIVSLQDILDDTKPKNSLPKIIGGLTFKRTFTDILTDVKPANEQRLTEKNLTTLYI